MDSNLQAEGERNRPECGIRDTSRSSRLQHTTDTHGDARRIMNAKGNTLICYSPVPSQDLSEQAVRTASHVPDHRPGRHSRNHAPPEPRHDQPGSFRRKHIPVARQHRFATARSASLSIPRESRPLPTWAAPTALLSMASDVWIRSRPRSPMAHGYSLGLRCCSNS